MPTITKRNQQPRHIVNEDEKLDPETGLKPTPSVQRGTFVRDSVAYQKENGNQYEDPFGDEENSDTKYRTLSWWQAGVIMIAETISLGVLALPSVFNTLGLVPGVLIIVGLGIIATYTGYVIGQFKLAYPHIHTFADAGEVLFSPLGVGRLGREFFGAAQVIFWIFTMGSHVLTFTIMLNTLTDHATCTIVWSIVALVVFWFFNIPRTLKAVSWLSLVSFTSIIAAVLILMISLGVKPTNPSKTISAAKSGVEFATAFNSVSNIVFAYAGHLAFFNFISELKDARDFPKALYLLQICDISVYVVVGVVVYIYAASPNPKGIPSPALGAANETVKKVAWGIAIPTIVIAGVVYGHVATKYIYVRLFRGTRHLGANTVYSIGVWLGISLILWTIAWIIAESIPVFNDLLALISALFASWFTYGLSAILWFFLNRGRYFSSARKIFLSIFNLFILGIAVAIFGIGLYASGTAIHEDSKSSSGSWTCANNGQ